MEKPMNAMNPSPGADIGLPKRKSKTLTVTEWCNIHDGLTLALDAIADGPDMVDHGRLLQCIAHQRDALRIAHARLEKIGGQA
jgi:hypothetical protein